ncbi:hypothetical protein LJ739_01465 [Aestuariibacter halophilus]|uniref:Tat pathway signal sequence domain protein n=1 Tax=Fluctibacter halophilus TaxID=226011 RepID=A0ABS8G448_9ALTE|nr:hypothetical protein [Aestuariibacter halophilus]MCC2614906.1 hypothetical protein [Aestuariibacter halophilus]
MTTEDKNTLHEDAQAQSNSTDNSRRKWLKRAGIAAPSLLVLANRPALAGSCSISGFMSARVGTSLTTHDPGMCHGWSPGNWKNDRGEITFTAWAEAGVNTGDAFNTHFSTSNMSTGFLRKVVNGVPEAGAYSYTSQYSNMFMSVLNGAINGTNNLKDTTMHSAAAFLNASFLANGGGGTNPDPWMQTYMSPDDVVALYLLYELMNQNTVPSGVNYQYERGGAVIAVADSMQPWEYANFFVSIANGSASSTWGG